ncbi:MAG: hypothetical protein RLY20_1854 [Verrucomicrobiota bacterium]|jgi:uncharacterized protein (TIGR03663 family)
MKAWMAFFFVAVLAALALRLPELERRPMHNDEGVNAVKFGQLWDHGEYRYDPNEHHGPTLHYLTAAFCKLTGAPDYKNLTESRLRLVTALVGLALLLPLLWLRNQLGRGALVAAAFFTALSPALVFYGRYWIHEELLVLFTFALLVAGWRFVKGPSWQWAILAGASLGLIQATKETFVFVIAAAIGALVLDVLFTAWLRRLSGENGLAVFAAPERRSALLKHLGLAVIAWFVVWAALFSSFGSNWPGLLDSFRTFATWSDNAGHHSPHAQAWDFYLERLFWFKSFRGIHSTEVLVLVLAIFAIQESFRRKPRMAADPALVRFIAFYTVLLTGIYAAIPYKTPWCALGFLHGFILLAGVGATVLWRLWNQPVLRYGSVALVVLAAAQLGWQAWRLSFPLGNDRGNPWVYAHTSDDLVNLVEKVNELGVAAQGNATMIQVVTTCGDCWPLPWYLRKFERTGWWSQPPEDLSAPIVIASADLKLPLDERGTHFMAGYFELRPKVFLQLFVERGLWEKSLKR